MPDDSPDTNLTLRISGDASGATTAALQAEGATLKVAVAARDAAGATQQLSEADKDASAKAEQHNAMMKEGQQALMRNAFYIHRLAEGFKDLSQGGRMTGQGMMDIAESLQVMLGPQSAIYFALLQIPLMLGSLALAHHKGGDEAKAHADAEKQSAEAIKKASEAYSQTVKAIEESGVGSYDNIAKAAARAAAAIEENIRATKELQRAQDELNDAELAARLAKIDLQEAEAEEGTTPEQKKEIERQFSMIKLKARQDRAQEKANAVANEKAQDIADTQAEIAAALDAQSKKDAELKRQREELAKAEVGIAGIPSDADLAQSQLQELRGKQKTGALSPDEAARLEQLERDTPNLVFKQAEVGPTYKDTLEAAPVKGVAYSGGLQSRLKEALELEQENLGSSIPGAGETAARYRAMADSIQAQIDALARYQGAAAAVAKEEAENARSKETTNAKVIEDQDKITAQQVALKAKRTEASTVTTLGDVSLLKTSEANRSDAWEKAIKKKFEDDEAVRQGQIDDLDAQILKTTDATIKAALEKQKGGVEATGIKAKADYAFTRGDIDQVQRDALYKKAGMVTTNADTTGQKQITAEDNKELRDDQKQLAETAKRVEDNLKATGHADLVKSISGIADFAQRNIALTEQLVISLDPKLQAMGEQMRSLERKIHSLANRNNN